jgi:hypothetical protein
MGKLIADFEALVNSVPNPTLKDLFNIVGKCGPRPHKHSQFYWRLAFCKTVSWCLIDEPTLSRLKEFFGSSDVLEVFSGRGFLSKALQLSGVNVRATDILPPERTFLEIETISSVDAVQKYRPESLIMCWGPNWDEDCMLQTLEAFLEVGGKKLAWIGEHGGAGDGGDKFRELMQSNFDIEDQDMPRWSTSVSDIDVVYDVLCTCTRKV